MTVKPGCDGKTRYASPAAAHDVNQRMLKRHKRGKSKHKDNRTPSRPYHCKDCGGWHNGTSFTPFEGKNER